MRPYLQWFIATGLAVWGLSALSGQLPSRVRLLLLFAIAFGLLIGWGAGVIADEIGARRSWPAAAITAVLTVAGLTNVAIAGYRQSVERARAIVAADPQQLTALRVLEGAINHDPELRQRYLEERARLEPEFGSYLMRRLLVFGRLPSPWPAVIWGAEIIAGAVAAVWMFLRRRPIDSPADPIPES
jgi:hypothetical protein